MRKMKPLGKLKRTARGFEIIEFKDCYGTESSLQASSMALLAKPGPSAVWLGNDHESVNPLTQEKMGARMHLNRDQVMALIGHLANWLHRDTFKLPTNRVTVKRKKK